MLRAVDQCSVKRHLAQPPLFEFVLEPGPYPKPESAGPSRAPAELESSPPS
jgi:hypothetical protein